MDLCQSLGSYLFFRLHSPSLLSVCMSHVVCNPKHYFNLFDVFAHSTISSGKQARVLSDLLPFHGVETPSSWGLLFATGCLWSLF